MSDILPLLLTKVLCPVLLAPQHENKFITGLFFASSIEMINKYAYHLDALVQNILGKQC
jgi:hypothetical protein